MLAKKHRQQGPLAPRALPRFTATTDPSATLTPPLHFPVSSVIEAVFLREFLPGTWRASPVASRALVTVLPPNTPPESFAASSSLRQTLLPSPILRKLGLRSSSISRPHYVHFRCGPVTRSPFQERLCRWASDVWSPAHLPSKLRGSGSYPGRLCFPAEHASLPWTHPIKEHYGLPATARGKKPSNVCLG